jgi:hypothetical protein
MGGLIRALWFIFGLCVLMVQIVGLLTFIGMAIVSDHISCLDSLSWASNQGLGPHLPVNSLAEMEAFGR